MQSLELTAEMRRVSEATVDGYVRNAIHWRYAEGGRDQLQGAGISARVVWYPPHSVSPGALGHALQQGYRTSDCVCLHRHEVRHIKAA